MRPASLLLPFGLGALLLACGSTVTEEPTGGAGGGGASTSTTTTGSSSSTGAGGSPVGCAPTVPDAGAACPKLDLVCTYGDSPFVQCRSQAQCTSAGWSVIVPPPDCDFPDPSCPQTPMHQAVCQVEGARCAYPDGTQCGCTSCPGPCGPPPPFWVCGTPEAGCPTTAPNAGVACSTPGLQCVYGDPCVSGVATKCEGGAWIWEQVGCPL
ncbi:MAG: hypothetical protein JNL21_01860 [Myxococcales bacterium]|nr:hypothetical protein [Myxococcales bacterium]